MPLYDLQCLEGHMLEQFVHSADDYGCETVICELCGSTMDRVLSFGKGLTYFCEKNGRLIENLGHEPVMVTSEKQHRDLMRKNGVTWASTDDMLHAKTRRALDARRPDVRDELHQAFARIKENL